MSQSIGVYTAAKVRDRMICHQVCRIDESVGDLLALEVSWDELIWRLADVYEHQICEYDFDDVYHALLLCPKAVVCVEF